MISHLSDLELERLLRYPCPACKGKPGVKYFPCDSCSMKMCTHYMETKTQCNICKAGDEYESADAQAASDE